MEIPSVLFRALCGFVLGAVIALIARRGRVLSASGAIAAVAVATAVWAAGWSWGIILVAFFVTGTALSKTGELTKRKKTGDVVEKGSERDWRQVLANGGAFASIAVASVAWPSSAWNLAAAGAIAASTADTWATEIGTLASSPARSITTLRKVATGTSGGVTVAGTAAALAGASFIGILACLAGWPRGSVPAAIAGGFLGATIDSVLGAAVQSRRWCERCGRGTERAVHTCGTPTIPSGGISWLDNDAVNAVSSLAGAVIAAMWLA